MHTLQQKLYHQTEASALKILSEQFPNQVVFSTSFGMEDQLITHLIFSNLLPIDIFTLDTGRLFTETYYTWVQTCEYYKKSIKAYYPNAEQLERYVTVHTPNAFYKTEALRKECCFIRKVEPLTRALKGKKVWVTGLRAQQSPSRENLSMLEWDNTYQLYKFHPLLHWRTEQVLEYLKTYQVPYNPLHDKGFVSIGCAPCTRAIKEGEDFRAGRWWWEDKSKKECGLHISK